MRPNMWTTGGTAVPIIGESVYREIDFIENLLFGRFFSSESAPPIPEMGRAFTLPDDASGAVAVTARPALPISTQQASGTESVPDPRQRNTHVSSSSNQPKSPAQPPKQSAETDLRDEINELLRSLNLEKLSPNEEQQLQSPSTLQLFLEPPPTAESPASGAQPTPSAGEKGSPPDQKPRKSRRFSIPKFSGFGSDALGLAATIVQMIDISAKLATQVRSLSDKNSELVRLASTLSRVSDVLLMMYEISRVSMSGPIQDLALKLVGESEEAIVAAEHILVGFHTKPVSSTALARLFKKTKFWVNRQKVKNVTQALERLDGTFLFVLQIHQAKITDVLQDGIRNLRYEMQDLLRMQDLLYRRSGHSGDSG